MLEQSDIIGGCCSTFETNGYKFDVGASIVEIIQPMDRFFELMGKKREDYIELIPCDPIYSFITEDGRRFSYPTDIDETTKVIENDRTRGRGGMEEVLQHGHRDDRQDDGRGDALADEHLPEAMSMVVKNPDA